MEERHLHHVNNVANCFSGATRNFEALKRAEEQAEREEKAYREELENNPMKLLEVRRKTAQGMASIL
jgi:Saf4/Yju2 protein